MFFTHSTLEIWDGLEELYLSAICQQTEFIIGLSPSQASDLLTQAQQVLEGKPADFSVNQGLVVHLNMSLQNEEVKLAIFVSNKGGGDPARTELVIPRAEWQEMIRGLKSFTRPIEYRHDIFA